MTREHARRTAQRMSTTAGLERKHYRVRARRISGVATLTLWHRKQAFVHGSLAALVEGNNWTHALGRFAEVLNQAGR